MDLGLLQDAHRRLLTHASVPVEIPDVLVGLTAAAASRNWKSGPMALAETRNSVVHPELRGRLHALPAEARVEAWQLAL